MVGLGTGMFTDLAAILAALRAAPAPDGLNLNAQLAVLRAEVAGAVQQLAAAKGQIAFLRRRLDQMEQATRTNGLFVKAFRVAGFRGDYLEFGVLRGDSLASAYWAARMLLDEFLGGTWEPDNHTALVVDQFNSIRFFGFDSFAGLPELSGPDADMAMFAPGSLKSTVDEAMATLQARNVDTSRCRLVKGFFGDVCTPELAAAHNLREASVVHIHSVLYQSAVEALRFCTPYLRNGSVIVFDDWFQFAGSPDYGEQRAFREWREANPDIRTSELAREGWSSIAFVVHR